MLRKEAAGRGDVAQSIFHGGEKCLFEGGHGDGMFDSLVKCAKVFPILKGA